MQLKSLLVHKTIAPTFLPMASQGSKRCRCTFVHSDATAQKVADTFKISSTLATDENRSTEYGVLKK
jgi:glutamate-5-semialdehyde dehydrogenase